MLNYFDKILKELYQVLDKINQEDFDLMAKAILGAKTIITCGAGRVGMTCKAFGMRLGHLGFKAFALGDTTVPAISTGDLLIIASGSGETQTIYDIALIAKKSNAKLLLVTGNSYSRIGKISDIIVELKAPSKTKSIENFISIQPMTSLNEQCLFIFFDAFVLYLMEILNQTHEDMWTRHSNLE